MHIAAFRIARTWAKLLIGRSVYKSYSQSGEDAIARTLLQGTKRGIYVDVGAFDPVLYSNTYHFYRTGWRGLVIDPNKALKPLFRVLRPRDTFIHTAVGLNNELTYHRFADGAYNSLDPKQVATLADTQGLRPVSEYKVRVRPLSELVRNARLPHIDFMSIDVEGMDEEVLSTYDWKIRPRVVAVEDTAFDPERPGDSGVCRFMLSRQYRIAGYAGVSILFKDLTQGQAPTSPFA